MSVDQLSFQPSSSSSSHPPSITLTKDSIRSRKVRNRQYVPSDDEDEDDLTDNDNDLSDNEFSLVNKPLVSPSTSTISSRKQHKKVTPLPSDDEDEDNDDDVNDSEDDDHVQSHLNVNKKRLYRLQGVQSTSQLGNYNPNSSPPFGQVQRHSADESNVSSYPYDSDDDCVLVSQQQKFGSVTSGNDTMLTHGSQLHQWQHMQQYHQSQMAQFNNRQPRPHFHQPHPVKSHSSSSHLRRQHQQVLSGMELMTQLEQDRAEAKRQKPKLNPTHAKIHGLLAKLPEPGAHNISFQHVYQQQQQQQKHKHHQGNRSALGRSPSPTPSTRSCTPHMMQQQQLMAGPYNMYGYPFSHYYQQQHPSRSGSAMSVHRP